jgi:hypothetical protein
LAGRFFFVARHIASPDMASIIQPVFLPGSVFLSLLERTQKCEKSANYALNLE